MNLASLLHSIRNADNIQNVRTALRALANGETLTSPSDIEMIMYYDNGTLVIEKGIVYDRYALTVNAVKAFINGFDFFD